MYGGSDPNDYGIYLTQIAMFSNDDNIWIDAGQLNEARYVSFFCLRFCLVSFTGDILLGV